MILSQLTKSIAKKRLERFASSRRILSCHEHSAHIQAKTTQHRLEITYTTRILRIAAADFSSKI